MLDEPETNEYIIFTIKINYAQSLQYYINRYFLIDIIQDSSFEVKTYQMIFLESVCPGYAEIMPFKLLGCRNKYHSTLRNKQRPKSPEVVTCRNTLTFYHAVNSFQFQ
ncbi:Hypothetical_protein [Hexamita inflata]|uniref:Hypothetical_protein n=1 Tax=Hexamita inflata TaxID=28002 RepID=A0AA86PMZ8_9EUKA|nr:Hypothetical protein HINF_LOCUS30800 [Hexamita inflata]